jgi:hypothetical protein
LNGSKIFARSLSNLTASLGSRAVVAVATAGFCSWIRKRSFSRAQASFRRPAQPYPRCAASIPGDAPLHPDHALDTGARGLSEHGAVNATPRVQPSLIQTKPYGSALGERPRAAIRTVLLPLPAFHSSSGRRVVHEASASHPEHASAPRTPLRRSRPWPGAPSKCRAPRATFGRSA